jgi:hypothetical protein
MFGGQNASANPINQTWEWNGTDWTQRFPSTAPSPRWYCPMAYDSARGVTVLFGGSTGGNQTWEWDGTNWTQRFPPASPSSRYGHSMAFDSVRGVCVLFGGYSSVFPPGRRNDTWEWNGTTWTQRFPATPPSPREEQALAYDSARRVTVLFGGLGNQNQFYADTWEWNGTTWTQRFPAASTSPRRCHAMAYDSVRGVTVLFGGRFANTFYGDTWELMLEPITADAAGPYGACGANSVGLNGQATYQTSVQWSTSGTGTFSNPDTLTAIYHPGNQDVLAGSVMLTLTASGDSACGSAMSSTTLSLHITGTADANGDGQADGEDIPAFVGFMLVGGSRSAGFCAADMNDDGLITADDLTPFVTALLAP